MKKMFTQLTSMATKGLIIACTFFFLPNLVSAQVTGDYRTTKSGTAWATAADWQTWNGTAWATATVKPDATNNVYVQSGHTAVLSGNESCKDLYISTGNGGTVATPTGTDGSVTLASNTLSLNGKLSTYFGGVSTTLNSVALSVTATAVAPVTPLTTADGTGKLSVVGSVSRSITLTGEWGSNNTSSSTAFNLEINMTGAATTATVVSGIKCRSWTVTSGTLAMGTLRMIADAGGAGTGDITIASGAIITSSATGTAASAVAGGIGGGLAGTFDLKTGGILRLSGAAPNIEMTTLTLNGTVEYTLNGTQTLLSTTAGTGAGIPNTYKHLTISGVSVNKTLSRSTTVTGNIVLNNAILVVGANTLTLGGSSITRVGGTIDASNAAATVEFTNTAGLTLPASVFTSNAVNNLTINNSAAVTLGSSLTVTNALALTAGNITTGANTLTLPGTMTRTAGTITANNTGGATLAFTNPASVTLPAAYLSGGLYNMIVNGGGVVLGGSFTLNNQLTLTAGNITLGSSTITGNASLSPSITGGSATRYIIADGAGKLTMPHLAGALQTYPVGTATSYDPVTAQPTDATSISVGVKLAFDNAITDAAKVATKQWDISSSAPSSTVLTLTPSNPVTTTTPKMGHYTGSAWEELAATRSGDTWTATTTSFSPFGAGEVGGFAAVLPIELSNFKVKSSQKSNLLSWTTASETNNAYFDVQRATNGTDFQSIGQVKGNGTTAVESNYTFEDATPSVGTSYYRLRQVDFDGKETISKVVSVVSQKGALATFYPSVTKGELTIDVPNDAPTTLTITSTMGQTVFTKTNITSTSRLNISHLSTGTYFVTLKQGGVQTTNKLVKQ